MMRKRFAIARSQRGFVRLGGLFRMTPGFIGSESKFSDLTTSATNISTAGSIIESTLLIIDQGTSVGSMLGKKIIVTKVLLQGQIRLGTQIQTVQANVIGNFEVKVYIYLDKQCNGTAATIANLLESATFDAFREIDTTQQFSMLKRVYMNIPINVTSFDDGGVNTWTSQPVTKSFQMFLNMKLPVDYSGTTGRTIANIRTNNIGVMAIITQGSTVIPTIQFQSRIRFTDA